MRAAALISVSAIALAILLFAAPRPAPAGLFNSEYFKLDNGLEVVVIPNHRAPVVIHMMWYRVDRKSVV